MGIKGARNPDRNQEVPSHIVGISAHYMKGIYHSPRKQAMVGESPAHRHVQKGGGIPLPKKSKRGLNRVPGSLNPKLTCST